MLNINYTEELLGLKDISLKNVERRENELCIHIEMHRRVHKCPKCGERTSKVHDYRTQAIKDIPAFGEMSVIYLRKRRHVCPICGKRFYETVPFLPRYHRTTNRLAAYVIESSDNLTEEEADQIEAMLKISERLRQAYFMKNEFHKFMDCKTREDAKKQLGIWNMMATGYNLPEFQACTRTLINWSEEILNSFEYRFSNGYTEGVNNKIKVIRGVTTGC